MKYSIHISMFVGILLTTAVTGCQTERPPQPENRIVVIIDASGSYWAQQENAVRQVRSLLDQIGDIELRRWERAHDRITLISLDAIPAVIWRGTVEELHETSNEVWVTRFEGRRDYRGCTDVPASFRLAAAELEGDPRHVHKYLFIFSDLLNEPPTTSLRRCTRPAAVPDNADDFPWEAMRDVAISVFWMPPAQKLAWHRHLGAQGMDNWSLYTVSESDAVQITRPPQPIVERSEEEIRADAERLKRRGMTAVTVLGGGFLLMIGLLFTLAFVVSHRCKRTARRSRQPAHSPHSR